MDRLNIGIVGGSLAGCTAAALLLREGHNVTVFERTESDLVGRGGGIGTMKALLDQIKQDGLIPDDFAHFDITGMPFVGKHPGHEPYGRSAWAIPMSFAVFQWNELWRNLRNNVPDSVYHRGVEITAAGMQTENLVTLTTSQGIEHEFDLVLFADGYRSLGRKILFPDAKLKYRGYFLWRGLLNERDVDNHSPLKSNILRLSYIKQPGHNVMYFIPDQHGTVTPGSRVFNWAAYVAVDETSLAEMMTDKDGTTWEGTLPPGLMRPEIEMKLKSFLARNTPGHFAEIVNKTSDSYIQVIYTLDLQSYYQDRMCLIGDAGMVVQPFTGSGVFKGYQNINDLITSMNDEPTLDSALSRWSNEQVQRGRRLRALGEQMEKAFIWEQPDFAEITSDETEAWWRAAVTFPDEFGYKKQ